MPVEQSDIVALLKRIHLFRGIDDQRLESVAAIIEQVDLPADEVIFELGDTPVYFYFIARGRVTVSGYRNRDRQEIPMGVLEEQDYFGEELLELNWPRQVRVETLSDVTLLRITVPEFVRILEIIPTLTPRLQLILNSYRLKLKVPFSWRENEEPVYFCARSHMIFMWAKIFPPLLFGLIFIPLMLFLNLTTPLGVTTMALLVISILITVSWLAWNFIDWTNDFFVVTNRRVLYQERVVLLYDSRQESPLQAVQSTSINTTQIGRWLGYGNVAIRTYIGTIMFRGVSNPEQVMALIQEQQTRAQTSERRAELRTMESVIEGKIGYGPPPKPKPKPEKPRQLTPMQRFLADIAHLRYEINGTILYRTHWFLLFGKIGVPSLILLGFGALILISALGHFPVLSLQATCALSFMMGGIVFIWWFYQFMDWHNDVYLITPDQIVDVNKKPLGREFRQAAPLKNILSIEFKRLGIIGLLLNFGTVYIRVGDQQLTFDNVYNPSEVQRELFHRLAAKNYAEKQASSEGERQRASDWIAAYDRVVQRHRPPQSPPPPVRRGF